MMIDRIGSVDPLQNGKKSGRVDNIQQKGKADSISLSTEAVEKGELFQAMELVSTASDVRSEKIMELKKKINDPDYINDAVVSLTADRIMDAFGL